MSALITLEDKIYKICMEYCRSAETKRTAGKNKRWDFQLKVSNHETGAIMVTLKNKKTALKTHIPNIELLNTLNELEKLDSGYQNSYDDIFKRALKRASARHSEKIACLESNLFLSGNENVVLIGSFSLAFAYRDEASLPANILVETLKNVMEGQVENLKTTNSFLRSQIDRLREELIKMENHTFRGRGYYEKIEPNNELGSASSEVLSKKRKYNSTFSEESSRGKRKKIDPVLDDDVEVKKAVIEIIENVLDEPINFIEPSLIAEIIKEVQDEDFDSTCKTNFVEEKSFMEFARTPRDLKTIRIARAGKGESFKPKFVTASLRKWGWNQNEESPWIPIEPNTCINNDTFPTEDDFRFSFKMLIAVQRILTRDFDGKSDMESGYEKSRTTYLKSLSKSIIFYSALSNLTTSLLSQVDDMSRIMKSLTKFETCIDWGWQFSSDGRWKGYDRRAQPKKESPEWYPEINRRIKEMKFAIEAEAEEADKTKIRTKIEDLVSTAQRILRKNYNQLLRNRNYKVLTLSLRLLSEYSGNILKMKIPNQNGSGYASHLQNIGKALRKLSQVYQSEFEIIQRLRTEFYMTLKFSTEGNIFTKAGISSIEKAIDYTLILLKRQNDNENVRNMIVKSVPELHGIQNSTSLSIQLTHIEVIQTLLRTSSDIRSVVQTIFKDTNLRELERYFPYFKRKTVGSALLSGVAKLSTSIDYFLKSLLSDLND